MKKEQTLLPQSYTSDQLDQMEKTWDKSSFAMALDARMRQIEKDSKLRFIETGLICLKVEQGELWKVMYGGDRYRSFGSWMTDAAPQSRATAYMALQEIKKVIADGIPLDTAKRLPRCNLKTVNRLSTKLKKDPEILKAAEVMEERDFKRKIEKEHPDQHIEDDSPMRFKPSKSQRKSIEAAIDAAMILEEVHTREDAIEAICVEYLESHQAALEAHAAGGKGFIPKANGGSRKAKVAHA